MSDLSRVLGDLYGESEQAAAPASSFRPTAPEWADDERLDEAFASWTPGPPADAPAAEREMSVVVDAPIVPDARMDDDIAAAMNAALVDAGRDNEVEVPMASAPSYALPTYDDEPLPVTMAPVEEYLPEPEPVFEPEPVLPVRTGPWTRSHDDILPGRHAAPAGRHAKAPKAKAPKAPKAKAKGDKAPKVKAPKLPKAKAEKAPKPAGDAPRTFFGIELTFKRSQ